MTSRREFLASSAAAMAVNAARAAAPPRTLGIALCGLGSLSTWQLAPALQKTCRCHLAGIITGTPAKAAHWQAKYGIAARHTYSYDTMHKLADDPDIDVVYVVTPNALHLEHASAAAAAGKHVLCEKPMEISVERCQRMIDTVAAAGRRLAVAYRCRFEPHHLECARLAHSQELGKVKLVDAHFGFNIGAGVWRLQRALAGGGPLMDVGIYCLQATRYLTGEEPEWVSASMTRGDASRFSEVEESVVWQARFPGGAMSHCSTSYNAAPLGQLRVLAERGWFGLEPAFNYDGLRGSRSDGKLIAFPPVDQFALELDDFADCIVSGRQSRVPGEEGLRDIRLLSAIYESGRSGRAVQLLKQEERA